MEEMCSHVENVLLCCVVGVAPKTEAGHKKTRCDFNTGIRAGLWIFIVNGSPLGMCHQLLCDSLQRLMPQSTQIS